MSRMGPDAWTRIDLESSIKYSIFHCSCIKFYISTFVIFVMILQKIKDFCAIPVFVYMGLTASIYDSRIQLALFFAIGSLIETLFVSCFYWYNKPWTIARLKDAIGAYGMWVFCLALLMAPISPKKHRWPYYFCFMAVVNSISIFSTVCGRYDWYTFKVLPRWL